jgi:hypothetical protein
MGFHPHAVARVEHKKKWANTSKKPGIHPLRERDLQPNA